MKQIKIEMIPLKQILPYRNNPRKNDGAVQYVKNSIMEFGFRVPLVIDADNVIVCGHTRYKAAVKLNIREVPCVRADDLTEEQVRAFRLADNKVAEKSRWDVDKLEQELEDLPDIDMSLFGFNIGGDEEPQERLMDGAELSTSAFEDGYKYECPNCGLKFDRGAQ
jgi:ParB-like chromosome segregation protein Spo0J